MGIVKLGFDDLIGLVQQGDLTFEAPGWLLVLRGPTFFYAQKPKGSAEKVFSWSRNLIRFSEGEVHVNLEYNEEDRRDPPCLTCGEYFPSHNKLLEHEKHHLSRRGIGYVARMKRRILAAKRKH